MNVLGKSTTFGAALAALSLLIGLSGPLRASTITFTNGLVLKDARIIAEDNGYVSVAIPGGTIRYPTHTIRTVDGKPFNADAVASTEAAAPLDAAPTPAESAVFGGFAPDNAAAAAPPASEEEAPAPTPVAEAAPASTPEPTAPAPTPDIETESTGRTWNFELLLFGLLIASGVWMRSLLAVQRDLFERRKEPRLWTMVALLLPGLGALIYFLSQRAESAMAAAKARAAEKAARKSNEAPAADSGTGARYPFKKPPAVDPAAYLASQGRTRKGLTFLDTDRKSVELNKDAELVSGLSYAQEMLEEALLEGASDIHIEPTGPCYRARFRLDGILHERTTYDNTAGRRLVTSLKTLAEIDVAEKRRAQDGRFRVSSEGREVDFRVATANSIHGEKMVIRVLDHQGGILNLTSLGMSDEMLARFQGAIGSKSGMILATGPTGSGKTSTLYAALRELDATRLNIMTIEDPAEYELAGATQIAVTPKAGITYESGLRSILRQDPDVILVGEMRDGEAAAVALRAALTGHLVFSTLHTKDAIGTISRLQDMGIERYQLASGLLMIVAQRLVRVLCPHCRSEYACEGPELESIGFSFEPGTPIYGPVGCDHCHGTGFKGRTGLFELLILDDAFRQAIGDGAGEAELLNRALELGFKSYRHDGAEKVLLGITTVDEVLQAA